MTRNSTDRSLKTVQLKSSSSVNSVGTSEQPSPIVCHFQIHSLLVIRFTFSCCSNVERPFFFLSLW